MTLPPNDPSASTGPARPAHPNGPGPSARRGLRTLALAAAGLAVLFLLGRALFGSSGLGLRGEKLVWFSQPGLGTVELEPTRIEAVRGAWVRLAAEDGQPDRWLNLEAVTSFAVE